MVGNLKTDGTILMGGPISVVMKCKPQKGEGKRNEQEQGEFSLHRLTMPLTGLVRLTMAFTDREKKSLFPEIKGYSGDSEFLRGEP
jgi:hypothetical protein